MTVISVDLAARRYRDCGIAVLDGSSTSARVELISPESIGLTGRPEPATLAKALATLAAATGSSLILLDGPQGWRAAVSDVTHMRLCERQTRTPGKTGVPHVVKPASWTLMAVFSIGVFDHLQELHWPRFTQEWVGDRRTVEIFPTHCWRELGLTALPGKSSTIGPLTQWMDSLSSFCDLQWPHSPSHDELQAVVGGLAGLAIGEHGLSSCSLAGREPFIEDGHWREGFILSPKAPSVLAAS